MKEDMLAVAVIEEDARDKETQRQMIHSMVVLKDAAEKNLTKQSLLYEKA